MGNRSQSRPTQPPRHPREHKQLGQRAQSGHGNAAPAGAAIARMSVWLPLTLFVGGLATTPFVADPEDEVPFMVVFGAVALFLGAAAWLFGAAESAPRAE